jgi:AGCS family alanine or glycine:cation symporter
LESTPAGPRRASMALRRGAVQNGRPPFGGGISSTSALCCAVMRALALPFLFYASCLWLPAAPVLAQAQAAPSWFEQIDDRFGSWVVAPIETVLFADLIFWDNGKDGDLQLPFVVAWLVAGAVFFTLRMRFINLRAFAHAIAVTRGRYDDPEDAGEVSHFRALASALSATVGLGNIAGVAIAIGMGGPGAAFWMLIAGFFGMTAKFVECTLGQIYREVDAQGRVLGGPMRYLSVGLARLGRPRLGRALSLGFAILCIGGSFGGGNMFQSNQSYHMVSEIVPFFAAHPSVYGLMLALLVGMVILGGIRRIGAVAGVLVPVMCAVYVLAGLWILVAHASAVPAALAQIVREAFAPQAAFGGFLGVLVTGFRRAAFSNEAGIGSASIAHSAAATAEPVREGIVALLEPFIDTMLICMMTALVVVVTGAYQRGDADGVQMTAAAFATVLPWFPKVLSIAVFFFAFSTMISWSYYGERSWTHAFGAKSAVLYKVLFLVFAFLGPIITLDNVLAFSDLMILGMAFPNVLGAALLSGEVRERLEDYWRRYRSGHMEPRSTTGNGQRLRASA